MCEIGGESERQELSTVEDTTHGEAEVLIDVAAPGVNIGTTEVQAVSVGRAYNHRGPVVAAASTGTAEGGTVAARRLDLGGRKRQVRRKAAPRPIRVRTVTIPGHGA